MHNLSDEEVLKSLINNAHNIKPDTEFDTGHNTHTAVFNAVVDRRLIAGKIHITLYARDEETVEQLRKLRELYIRSSSESQCRFITDVEPPNLAGLFVRIN